MAYYYVKNGGTATGDAGRYETQQAGSFAALGAANYYNDIVAAMAATTSPVGGDFVNPSDLHNDTVGGNISWQGSTGSRNPVLVVCVDDENIDLGRKAGSRAIETVTDITFRNGIVVSGIDFTVSDDILYFQQDTLLIDSVFRCIGSTHSSAQSQDGSSLTIDNCEYTYVAANAMPFRISSNARVNIKNSSFTSTIPLTALVHGFGNNGGATLAVKGTDLSGIGGTLIADMGGDYITDDAIDVRFDMCKLATGVAFTNETFKSYNQRALFTRCSDSSAAAEYQYHLHAFGGDVNDDSAIYRNEDEPFTDSGQKISYEIVTNLDASISSPLWLDFPILRYSKLSVGATDTLRFYLTSDTVLTDKDIYIVIAYPDGTNKQTPNFLSSAPNTVGGTLDLMATGTTLTTDVTSTWTGGLSNNYQIDLNTSVNVGSDCLPIVKVYITKPSVTIQLASEFGLI